MACEWTTGAPPLMARTVDLALDPWLADLTPVLDTALDAVVVMREDGIVAGWNSVAEKIFGWSRAEAVGRELSELIIPLGHREAHRRGLKTYLETGRGPVLNRRIEISAIRSSCEEFPVELSITPTNVSGERLFLGFLRDISDRKAAEMALRESEARLAATYNHALVGIAEVDSGGRFIRANDQFSVITGYSPAELRAMTFFDITHPDDLAQERQLFGEQWSGAREGYTTEKRYVRKDGAVIWVELAASLVRSERGSETFGVRIVREITASKRSEERQRLLLNELNHRVKNTLAVVQSLAHQTFKGGAVPPVLLRSFEGRLAALAAAHNLLMEQNWEATPLRHAARAALAPFETAQQRISIDGPEILVNSAATVTLTLALHELATNAVKYGALSNDGGYVRLRWCVNGDILKMVWREFGGPPAKAPSKSGFGTRLLERGVAGEVAGTVRIEFGEGGVVCTIAAPLEHLTE